MLARGLAFAALAAATTSARNNGLGRTPSMALNMWNALQCDYNVTDLTQLADLMVSEGYLAAGYTHFNLDDCWQSGRTPGTNVIIPDPKKFPQGIEPFIAYVKAKGLKFGLYSDAGTATCAGRPGSYGHEVVDATTYAAWGVDYLKVHTDFSVEAPMDV